jgi:hypothetical protein
MLLGASLPPKDAERYILIPEILDIDILSK